MHYSRILLIPIILSLLFIQWHAATTEEQGCFDILTDYVKQDARFGREDIAKAYISRTAREVDLSSYATWFLDHRAGRGDKKFLARRNNIGTIITESNYITSQFVTFWEGSNFVFPLPVSRWVPRLWEDYGAFKNKIIYTNHIFAPWHPDDGVFVSCAYFRIVPAAGKTLNDVNPDNYKTNDINASWFSLLVGPTSPIIKDGHRFIVGKVNVPVKNWRDESLMTLEMITIAHDNESALFNEFETFPLQVKAMTDMDARDNVNTVQARFLKYVKESTCLKIPHTNTTELPARCGGQYKSITKDGGVVYYESSAIEKIAQSIVDAIIPIASARMEPMTKKELEEHGMTGEITIPQGMYINPGFRYSLVEKLDAIWNPVLTSYVMQAVTIWAETIMLQKQKDGKTLTADENIFLSCGIDYADRTKVISDWLKSVDAKKFDITNINYSNPKVWDCIIPFPDARNRNKIIPGSFAINQYNAAILSNNKPELLRLNQELQVDTREIQPNILGWLNYYNPLYNVMSRTILWILLLITSCISIIFVVRSQKK